MMTTREKLKKYFKAGNKPTQDQFYEWLDAYWHKEDLIPQESADFLYKYVPVIQSETTLSGAILSLTVPKDIKAIGIGAFAYDTKREQLMEVNFNEGIETLNMYCFTTQNIAHIKTPSTLKTIRMGVFYDQQYYGSNVAALQKITLNEGLEFIEAEAFNIPKAVSIKDLYIPTSVTYVGNNAFAIPSLQTVSAPAGLNLSQSGIPSTAVITYR